MALTMCEDYKLCSGQWSTIHGIIVHVDSVGQYLLSSFLLQVTFNPQDNTQICVVGNGVFKLFRYSEGNLKQFAFQKLEPQNYLCQTWVSDERVVVGTDNGKLLLFEAGELKNEFNLSMQVKDADAR